MKIEIVESTPIYKSCIDKCAYKSIFNLIVKRQTRLTLNTYIITEFINVKSFVVLIFLYETHYNTNSNSYTLTVSTRCGI